jgi:hypothetical protein
MTQAIQQNHCEALIELRRVAADHATLGAAVSAARPIGARISTNRVELSLAKLLGRSARRDAHPGHQPRTARRALTLGPAAIVRRAFA